MFLFGILLTVGYGIEFAICVVSTKERKRIFNLVVFVWFELIGLFLLFVVPFFVAIVFMLVWVLFFWYDRHVIEKLIHKFRDR